MKFDKYIDLTYTLANTVQQRCRCKHYSFIVNKNRLISFGFNNPKKTHPRNLKYRYVSRHNNNISEYVGIHSELSAIIRYGFEDCTNHTLINTRLNAHGELANSKPCRGCQNLLKQLNFRRVYYTNNIGKFEQL